MGPGDQDLQGRAHAHQEQQGACPGPGSTHRSQLTDLDNSIDAFFAALSPTFENRVTVLVLSEFGRRVNANNSGGTDHGTASVMLVAGANVRGGLHGDQPSLTALDSNRNLIPTVDYCSVYATIVGPWLGGDDQEIIGGTFPKLDLFAAGPGGLPGTGPAQASAGSAPAELTISEFGPVAAAAAQTIGRLTAPDPMPVPTKNRLVSEPGATAARDAAVESCLRDE